MTILERVQALPENPTVKQTAEAFNVTEQEIRWGMTSGGYPFGLVQEGKNGKRRKFSIMKVKIINWLTAKS